MVGGGRQFDIAIKDNWVYTLMIMQPDHITPDMFAEAVAQAAKKKPNPALSRLRLASFCEGLCVQTMHLGPYATEPATLEKMRQWAEETAITSPASTTKSTWATRGGPSRRS